MEELGMSKAERELKRRTMNVEDAGARLGLGKNAAYAAVHRGEIPVIKIGGRFLVPVDRFNKMLEQN